MTQTTVQWSSVAFRICTKQGLTLLFPYLFFLLEIALFQFTSIIIAVLQNSLTQQLLTFTAWVLKRFVASSPGTQLQANIKYLYSWLIWKPTRNTPFALSGAQPLALGTELLTYLQGGYTVLVGDEKENSKNSSFASL